MAPSSHTNPLIVYGAATAVGSFAIQLAQLSNIHPLICVAGHGIKHVEGLIDTSKGDTMIDYRTGDEHVVHELRKAAEQHGKLKHAFDAVSEKGSYVNICQALDKHGAITLVLPGKQYSDIPSTITHSVTSCGTVFENLGLGSVGEEGGHQDGEQGVWLCDVLADEQRARSWLVQRASVRGGAGGSGWGGRCFAESEGGKASAVKYVFRIADTEGVKT